MPELVAFLTRPAPVGYPTDYLLARIRSRRADLAPDRQAPRAAAPDLPSLPGREPAGPGPFAHQAREKMRREFTWVYLQMNQGVREVFAPLFLWFELRTMLTSLRLVRGGARDKLATLLAGSLLAQPVQQALLSGPSAAAAPLAELLAALGEPARELGALYREGKGREYEELCVRRYLEGVARLPLHPVLREFFCALIDQLNLLALAKQLRWQPAEPGGFIRGGALAVSRLEAVLKKGRGAGLAEVLRPQPGPGELPALPENPEQFLLGRLTRHVTRLGRDPLGLGGILAYLWACAVAARNASLVHHASHLGEAALAAEVIR